MFMACMLCSESIHKLPLAVLETHNQPQRIATYVIELTMMIALRDLLQHHTRWMMIALRDLLKAPSTFEATE